MNFPKIRVVPGRNRPFLPVQTVDCPWIRSFRRIGSPGRWLRPELRGVFRPGPSLVRGSPVSQPSSFLNDN